MKQETTSSYALDAIIAKVIEEDRFNRRDVLGWEQGYKCGKAECSVRLDLEREKVQALVEALTRIASDGASSLHATSVAKDALTNFAGNSAQLNKTSGNGEEATREPDLNSAARKPMQ